MLIKREIQIDMGHSLSQYNGPCFSYHGHRCRILCSFEGSASLGRGYSLGMIEDFSYLKQVMMKEIHEVLDHGWAIWKGDTEEIDITNCCTVKTTSKSLVEYVGVSSLDFIKARNKKVLVTDDPPTAETLAKYFGEKVRMAILDRPFYLHSLEWWETPNNCAVYFPGEERESFNDDLSLKEKMSEKGY